MRLVSGALLLSLLLPGRLASAASIYLSPVSAQDTARALALNTPGNPLRYERLHKMFDLAGCRKEFMQELHVPRAMEPDLVCTLPGVLTPQHGVDSRVVVFARYDHFGPGSGAIDNWSGAAMLPLLFDTIFPGYREHTIQFVATSGPEGLNTFLKTLKYRDKRAITAVVDLRDIGMETTRMDILSDASDSTTMQVGRRGRIANDSGNVDADPPDPRDIRAIAASATATVTRLGLPPMAIPYTEHFFTAKPQTAKDEFDLLADSGIPSVIIHSITKANAGVPGSAEDSSDKINPTAYYATYYYTSIYLLVLDHPQDALAPQKLAR